MADLPLKGIRVTDLSMWFAGPMASRLMADMGAEVIKVESLHHIDPWRGRVDPVSAKVQYPLRPSERPYDCSPGFNLQNRNKYGITLDLRTPEGKEILKKLVAVSDVLLENYSPRVMPKLGLDYETLIKVNPKLIMMSLPALGSTGPFKDFLAFGQTIDCMSGMSYLTGYIGEEPMLQSRLAYGDPLSGMNAAFAIISALRNRNRTGKGMHIEMSQVEGLIAFNADSILDYTMNGRIRERIGNRDRAMSPHGCYRCKGEDNWVAIAVPSDKVWQKFSKAIGLSVSKDERFIDVISRHENQDELDKLIEAWTIARSQYEVMDILQSAGIPAGPVLDAAQLGEDPHLKARGVFQVVTHPVAGTHPYIGAFAKFSKTPLSIRMPAPCLGQHIRNILGELLGMTSKEIQELEDKGVTGTKPSREQQGSAT